MESDNIITVSGVSKSFGSHKALDNVSLDIPRGKVYGLLGPNGAGKTTLIRIINHITTPDVGSVTFDGHPLTQADVANIGYLPEERGLYKKMTVGEQAIFFARLKGLSKAEARVRLKEWFDRLDISDWWSRKVEELSKGMAQKVQFIVTVLHKPKLFIFDEPFSGFDPINANMLKEQILRLRDEGATVIFSTHNMSSVEEVCDAITLINQGRNILSGNVDEIRRRHSDGRYSFTFTGNADGLPELLAPLTTEVQILPAESAGETLLEVRMAPGVDVKAAIARVNEAVNLRSFSRHIASMNEIFINSVNSYPHE